jgi:hypothetical protein
MFVNRLRSSLDRFEVFNVSHRGWGTDQELLAFRQWRYPGRLRLVVLMFCENDFEDNNNDFRHGAAKPKFELVDGQLVLTNVPPPRVAAWDAASASPPAPSANERLWALILGSHFLHDLSFRIEQLKRRPAASAVVRNGEPGAITRRIIRLLRDEVAAQGATLVVVAIPSRRQYADESRYVPYQEKVARICRDLSIEFQDLGPACRASFLRVYHRLGRGHWNARGHRIAADAIDRFLASRQLLN